MADLPDDFEWVVPGHPEGAVRRGPHAVTAFFRDWIDQWDDPDTDWTLEETRPDTVLALATTRGRGRASGVPVEFSFAQVWTVPRRRARPHGPVRRRREGAASGERPVRVVAGEFKGRRLHAPRGPRTRPTADRVREALFSMLGDVSGARVLDLYAGSGALGIEALSRGAGSALFVERDRQALTALRRNLEAVGADADVRSQDVQGFLARPEGTFDLVFCDPPYDEASRVAAALSEALPAMLGEDARIVTESDKRNPLLLPLPLVVERAYGDTRIAIHSAT